MPSIHYLAQFMKTKKLFEKKRKNTAATTITHTVLYMFFGGSANVIIEFFIDKCVLIMNKEYVAVVKKYIVNSSTLPSTTNTVKRTRINCNGLIWPVGDDMHAVIGHILYFLSNTFPSKGTTSASQ